MTLTERITQELLDAVDQPDQLDAVFARYSGSKGPLYGALARLRRDPRLLLEELRRRREEGSDTRTELERELTVVRKRQQVVPGEMDRLIDGYGKGLIPDDRMRTRMTALTDERDQLAKKAGELEQKLQRLQAVEGMEEHVLAFVKTVRDKIDILDGHERRRLLELVLEDVTCLVTMPLSGRSFRPRVARHLGN